MSYTPTQLPDPLLPSFAGRGLALLADFMLAFIICILFFNLFYNQLVVSASVSTQQTILHEQAAQQEQILMMAEVRDLDSQKISILIIIIYWSYFTISEYLMKGSSPGKRIFKLRVVDPNSSCPLPFWRILLRSLIKTISLTQFAFALVFISIVMMLVSKKRIALHDWVAKSLVIKNPIKA